MSEAILPNILPLTDNCQQSHWGFVLSKSLYVSEHVNKTRTIMLFELRHDKTNRVSVRPTKTQISLGSEDSDQTGRMRMPRLI